MTPLLSARDLTKSYISKLERVDVLRGCSLSLAGGEFKIITGPSGSGKSTLLNLLAGLDAPDSGEVRYRERPITPLSDGEISRLRREFAGLIFQSFELIHSLSCRENIELPLIMKGIPRARRTKLIGTMAATLGITRELNRKINYISGGQRQRVAIARTLAVEPTVILGDEITGNLDRATSHTVFRHLKELCQQGRGILTMTHDTGLLDYATHVYALEAGVLKEQ